MSLDPIGDAAPFLPPPRPPAIVGSTVVELWVLTATVCGSIGGLARAGLQAGHRAVLGRLPDGGATHD